MHLIRRGVWLVTTRNDSTLPREEPTLHASLMRCVTREESWSLTSGHAGFWDALHPTQVDEKFAYRRNRETNGAFQKHIYHHQTIQRNEMFANDARFLSQYSRAFRDGFPHAQFDARWDRVPLFAYAVRITSMTLRTATFLCVLCAEICVNATAASRDEHGYMVTSADQRKWRQTHLSTVSWPPQSYLMKDSSASRSSGYPSTR